MSKHDKLVERFKQKPKDFTWKELLGLLGIFGYDLIKNKGSRRKFMNKKTKHLISLHEPHPKKIIKKYQIDLICESLEKEGLI